MAPSAPTQIRDVGLASPAAATLVAVAGVVLSIERTSSTLSVTSYSPGCSEAALASFFASLAVSPEQAASSPAAAAPKIIVRIGLLPCLCRSGLLGVALADALGVDPHGHRHSARRAGAGVGLHAHPHLVGVGAVAALHCHRLRQAR